MQTNESSREGIERLSGETEEIRQRLTVAEIQGRELGGASAEQARLLETLSARVLALETQVAAQAAAPAHVAGQ